MIYNDSLCIRHTLTTYLVSSLLLVSCLTLSTSCTRERTQEMRGDSLTLSLEQHSAWIRLFNPFSPNARRFTRAGIYEPLLIKNSVTGEYTPWLATAYRWNEQYTELTFEIRDGVRFSDGTPMTAEDVVYSFNILKRAPALDTQGLWSVLERVELSAPSSVLFVLRTPHKPKLDEIAHQPIIPRHIWSKIEDPVTFTNPNPIATGPFTEVTVFRSQIYELSRNPFYWRAGQPKLRSLRFPAFPSNDQANLALVTGEIDWAGNFIPAIDRTFVAIDPQHHIYWFPLIGSMVNLIPNSTSPLLGDSRVRKALSYAIQRERLVKVAMYGYTRPADSTGLTDGFSRERDASVTREHPWTQYDPQRARALLKEAGLVEREGGWHNSKGEPLTLTIDVVSGWSDWVRAAQVIANDLRAIGIPTRVKTSEFSAWFDQISTGRFELAIGWSDDRGSLYQYYKWLMSPETVKPVGEASLGNFNRVGDVQVAEWLTLLKRGVAPSEERAINSALQNRYAELAPVIPLFPNPQWGAANTSRVEGFPTAEDPYAPLSPNREPECLLVLTRLKPSGETDETQESDSESTSSTSTPSTSTSYREGR